MNNHIENRDIEVEAIDLAKKSFQLYGVDENGNKVMGKKLTRKKLKREGSPGDSGYQDQATYAGVTDCNNKPIPSQYDVRAIGPRGS